MLVELSRQSEQPLYLQLAEQLRAKIEEGQLAAHSRLPASRVLAKELGVNRITVVNAYTELEAEGLVVSRVGSGTFVAPLPEWTPPRWGGNRRAANPMLAEIMSLTNRPGLLSFAGGAPASEFLPVNQFRRALNDVLRADGAAALQYEEAAGYPPLKEDIARQLQAQNIPVGGDDILITAGCQQALDMALRTLTRSRDSVLMLEDPCYVGLLDIVTSRRITPVGLPLDRHGLQTDHLEQLILRHRPQLIYVTPTFHNPTGVTMTLERRQALLELANRYGLLILEDASYEALRYEGQTLPTLKSLDSGSIVLQAGGFSKTLVPGIRIGYLVAPPSLHRRMIATKQTADILTSPLNQRALHTYLQSGHYAEHLQQVRRAYKERRDAMLAAIERHFPAEARWHSPQGGLYIWVEMPPDGPGATNLYLAAINQNVAFALGSLFSSGGSLTHAFRLNFVTHPPATIEEGIRRLGRAWQKILAQAPDGYQAEAPASMHIL